MFRKTQAHTQNSRVASIHISSLTGFSLEGWCSRRPRAASGEEPDVLQWAVSSPLGVKKALGRGATGSCIPMLMTP